MSDGISTALESLNEALSALEEIVESHMERAESLAEAETEIQRMGADRGRLAESLDNAQARSQQLENTNREVSRRLVDAMESIRGVLDKKQV